jgi:hypothetical protein
MKKLRVTCRIVVDVEPHGELGKDEEEQRAIDLVMDEPMAFILDENIEVAVEWVDV